MQDIFVLKCRYRKTNKLKYETTIVAVAVQKRETLYVALTLNLLAPTTVGARINP